jgi:hypothetical protein
MKSILKRALLFLLLTAPAFAQRAALTNEQIAAKIVQDSREDYYETGHPCACPEDRTPDGNRCGGRSAYKRLGGFHPFPVYCYPSDVSAAEIEAYRKKLTK